MSLLSFFKVVPKEKSAGQQQPPKKKAKGDDDSLSPLATLKAKAPAVKKKRRRKKRKPKSEEELLKLKMKKLFKKMPDKDDPSVKGQTLMTKFFDCSDEKEGKFEYLFQREKARREKLQEEQRKRILEIRAEKRRLKAEARREAKEEQKRLFLEDQKKRRAELKLKKQGKMILGPTLLPPADEPSLECEDRCFCHPKAVEESVVPPSSSAPEEDVVIIGGGTSAEEVAMDGSTASMHAGSVVATAAEEQSPSEAMQGILFLGSRLGARNARWMYQANVTAVLNATREIKNYFEEVPLLPTFALDSDEEDDDDEEPEERADAHIDRCGGEEEEEEEKEAPTSAEQGPLVEEVVEQDEGSCADEAPTSDSMDITQDRASSSNATGATDGGEEEEEEEEGEEYDSDEEEEEEEEEIRELNEEELEAIAEREEAEEGGEEDDDDSSEVMKEAMALALAEEKAAEEAEAALDFSGAQPVAVQYHRIQVADATEEPLYKYFEEAVAFLQEMLVAEKKNVLVHCREGMSRSPTLVIAYLMKAQRWSLSRAYEHTLKCNRALRINDGFKRQLMEYERTLFGCSSLDFFQARRRPGSRRSAPTASLGKRSRRSASVSAVVPPTSTAPVKPQLSVTASAPDIPFVNPSRIENAPQASPTAPSSSKEEPDGDEHMEEALASSTGPIGGLTFGDGVCEPVTTFDLDLEMGAHLCDGLATQALLDE